MTYPGMPLNLLSAAMAAGGSPATNTIPVGQTPQPHMGIGQRIGNFLGSPAALAFASGVLGGGTTGEALGRGLSLAQVQKQRSKALNTTAETFKKHGYYDLADMAAGGNADMALRIFLDRQKSINGGDFGKNFTYGVDSDGNMVLLQVNDKGEAVRTKIPEGVTPIGTTQQINQGTQFGTVNKAGQLIGANPVYTEQNEYNKVAGKEKAERDFEKPRVYMTMKGFERKIDSLIPDVDKAMQQSSGFTTGFLGDWLKSVAGTPAADLQETLQRIRANVSFEELRQLREQSKHGGALGQVSNFENLLLQAVQGSLQQNQSPQQLRENLLKIKVYLNELKKEKALQFQYLYGDDSGMQMIPSGGQPAQVPEPTPPAGGANFTTKGGSQITVRPR